MRWTTRLPIEIQVCIVCTRQSDKRTCVNQRVQKKVDAETGPVRRTLLGPLPLRRLRSRLSDALPLRLHTDTPVCQLIIVVPTTGPDPSLSSLSTCPAALILFLKTTSLVHQAGPGCASSDPPISSGRGEQLEINRLCSYTVANTAVQTTHQSAAPP